MEVIERSKLNLRQKNLVKILYSFIVKAYGSGMNVREIMVSLEVLRLIVTRFFERAKSQPSPSSPKPPPLRPSARPSPPPKQPTPPPKPQHISLMSAREALQSELKKIFSKREKNIYT
ncbi:MAG: hypothetical protein HWN65_17650 [Candidatus Helarchaeota archaeon]|nr:hypothetical protein [Candidatus Helarchaeota archaeon]